MWRWIVMMCCVWPSLALAAVYQCEENGHTVFTDQPCDGKGERIELGPFNNVEPSPAQPMAPAPAPMPPMPATPPAATDTTEADCPFINSTKLRRHIVAKEIVNGMAPADVERAWGRPSSKINSSSGVEWLYRRNQNHWKTVEFKNDCVVDWKIYEREMPYPYLWGYPQYYLRTR